MQLCRPFQAMHSRIYRSRGLAPDPSLVSIDLTHRCNLRCVFCYYHGSGGSDFNGEAFLPFSLLKDRLIDVIPCNDYYLTGGEPFLYPDLEPLLFYLRARGKNVSMSTNGTLLSETWAEKIVKHGLVFNIDLSVHGPEQVHDNISRAKGAFVRTVRGIKALQAYKTSYGTVSPSLTVACTINTKNVGRLAELAELAAEWEVDTLSFGNTVFTTSEISAKHCAASEKMGLGEDFQMSQLILGTEHHGLREEHIHQLITEVNLIQKSYAQKLKIRRSPNYDDSQMYHHYTDPSWVFRERCTYPWHNLRIHPSGKIVPCLGVTLGDIRQERADEVWNGDKFRQFRRTLHAQKLFPGCFRCCKLQ